MARLDDIPEPTRTVVRDIDCPGFATTPFVSGPPLSQRRIAMVSSAALIRRGDAPFAVGSAEFRRLPAATPAADILMSHVSINFDRAGFQRDINVVYPIDRLRELADEGVIGGVADTHYTIMGAIDPTLLEASADTMAAEMLAAGIDTVLLLPV